MKTHMKRSKFKQSLLAVAVGASLTLAAVPAVNAQQGGAIKGKITTQATSSALAGVVVVARSDVMPKPRTAITKSDGSYSLPLLIPGTYELTFTAKDGSVNKTIVEVLLDQTTRMNYAMMPVDDTEVITITAGTMIVREGDSSLTNSIGAKVIEAIPMGQDYRSLMKLIPGVQYSENSTLGPSAGGSGRDNKYGFDGVDVSLPMFGNLASEPSTHDIQSVSMDRGGAKAIGFNRSGGFAINTISKSGTNDFHAKIEYKTQPKSLVADKDDADGTKYELDKTWITSSVSGPLIEDELFFYASYYRPEVTKENNENVRGPVKDYSSVRNEYFGKLTYAPTDDMLFNVSYRDSDRDGEGLGVGAFDADSTSYGDDAQQTIFTVDGSLILDDSTTISFQYSTFELETQSIPDTLYSSVVPEFGASLNLNNLDQLGALNIPDATNSNPLYDSAGAQVLIDTFGAGISGGQVGGSSTINNQNFYRDSFEIALEHEFEMGETYHNIHIGYKWAEGTEKLSRLSNGWGSISYLGGLTPDDYTGSETVYYQTTTQQMSFLDETGNAVDVITSRNESFNFEINDTIEWNDFTFNIGVLISKDVLYGQGLKTNLDNVSGFELAPGHEYKMYTTDFSEMIQPRLGVVWEYDEDSTLFANYASYNPEASSLARAASWARNTQKTLNVFFDEGGNYLGFDPASGSSGKFFQEGIKPRRIDEFTIGASKLVTNELNVRGHMRYREGAHFWEDTWNGSRGYGEYGPFGGVPDHIAAKGEYIPELADYRAEVGGSSYVIAELDDAYTKYWEMSIEAEWQTDRVYLNASYVYSHYYGNFDADSVSGASDGNLFIGSSNLADGRGRQLWDGKDGDLSGDKPHVFKMYGSYLLDWEANVGFYLLAQSGDAWEAWDGSLYGYSSSTIRFAEPAGTRRSDSHWQLDLNYTQDFMVDDYVVKFQADLFNVFDNQTGRNLNPYVSSDTFGEPRSLYSQRRVQITASIEF